MPCVLGTLKQIKTERQNELLDFFCCTLPKLPFLSEDPSSLNVEHKWESHMS